jgi:hypothetical protein
LSIPWDYVKEGLIVGSCLHLEAVFTFSIPKVSEVKTREYPYQKRIPRDNWEFAVLLKGASPGCRNIVDKIPYVLLIAPKRRGALMIVCPASASSRAF